MKRRIKRRLPRGQRLILQAKPQHPAAWWPVDEHGWVTVRADGQGWTLGRDRAHLAYPKARIELAEGFRMTMRAEAPSDWRWGRWQFREVEP